MPSTTYRTVFVVAWPPRSRALERQRLEQLVDDARDDLRDGDEPAAGAGAGGADALEERALRFERDAADFDETGCPGLAAALPDVLVALAANEPFAGGQRRERERRVGSEFGRAEVPADLGELLLDGTVCLGASRRSSTRSRSSAVRSRPASSARSKTLLGFERFTCGARAEETASACRTSTCTPSWVSVPMRLRSFLPCDLAPMGSSSRVLELDRGPRERGLVGS